MKNFHLPLPEQTYASLGAEAERTGAPATTLVRDAADRWLRRRYRKARHAVIAAFAAETAGTHPDLDADPEPAGIEHPVNPGRTTR
jgi:hypothetical protein